MRCHRAATGHITIQSGDDEIIALNDVGPTGCAIDQPRLTVHHKPQVQTHVLYWKFHGIPSKRRKLKEGDVLSLDFGCIWEGFHSDSAVTVFVGAPPSEEAERLVRATEEALVAGVPSGDTGSYGFAKLASSLAADEICGAAGRDTVTVIPSNLYGPGDNYHPQNSHVLPALIRRFHEATEAGATRAGFTVLRLPLEIKDLFDEWLRTNRPDRAEKVLSLIRQMRGGALYQSGFGQRMQGEGPIADLLRARFQAAVKRLGLNKIRYRLDTLRFSVPETARNALVDAKRDSRQMRLF